MKKILILVVFCFLVLSACGSSAQAEVGFDQILIEDPTLFVQDRLNDVVLRNANLTPGNRHADFGHGRTG